MNLEQSLKKIQEDSEKIMRQIKEDGEREFNKVVAKFDKLDSDTEETRGSSRDTIYKIILISSSAIVFSVSLVSADFIDNQLNLHRLYLSWFYFLSVIVLGFLILFTESRLRHAIIWRHFLSDSQVLGGFKDGELNKKKTIREKLQIFYGVIISCVYPENHYLDKIRKDQNQRRKDVILSNWLLNSISLFKKRFIFWAENIFFILFILSLILFVSSFTIFK